jgi:hypothetical protein
MLRRLLNIASIVCLVACVALMGMWVRGDYWADDLRGCLTDRRAFVIDLLPGRMQLVEFVRDSSDNDVWHWLRWSVRPDELPAETVLAFKEGAICGFRAHFSRTEASLMLPYWFLVLASGSLAMMFQLRWPWRFNLRSLFIATTFLAVVLGMIAWLDRAWIGK